MPSATVALVDGNRVRDDDLAFFLRQLSASEAGRYAHFARRERRRQFVLGRILLRLAIGEVLNLGPATIDVIERPGNAPQVVLPDPDCITPGFSISHSGGWIACAVSRDSRLGLDIELIDPQRDISGISQSAFAACEQDWLRQQPDNLRVSAFYHLWSLREALYKLRFDSEAMVPLPSLVEEDGTLALRGHGWYSHVIRHPRLSCVTCSAQPLSTLLLTEPAELTRAVWLAAGS